MSAEAYAWVTRSRQRPSGLPLVGTVLAGYLLALGLVTNVVALEFLAGFIGSLALVYVLPEIVLALFLDVGAVKDSSAVSWLPVDLTLLLAAAIVIAIVLKCVREGVDPFPPPSALMAILAALVVASVLWSPAPASGLVRALRFESLTLLAFVAPIVLVRTRKSFTRLMIALVGAGLVVASLAHATHDVNKPLVVPGGIEIELGLDVGYGILAAVGYLFLARRTRMRAAWLVPAGYLSWIVLQSGSRGAVVAGAAGLLFIFVRQLVSNPKARGSILALIAAVTVTLAAGGIGVAGLAAKKYQAVLFSGNTSGVLGLREYLYRQGVNIAVHHPFGAGSGSFLALTDLNYPHDILLELADEHGFLAVSVFVLLLAAAWRSRIVGFKLGRRDESIVTGGLIIFCLAEALASLDINQDKPLWFFLGLAFALPRLARRST